nr:MAG: hypothetical protein DIU57_18310 [Pseudomonadota bacterium]
MIALIGLHMIAYEAFPACHAKREHSTAWAFYDGASEARVLSPEIKAIAHPLPLSLRSELSARVAY